MTSPLLQAQFKFASMLPALFGKIYVLGYTYTLGEAYRTPEQALSNAKKGIGIAHSLHCMRLAIDLNIFKDGVYLTDGKQFKSIGDYWKSLDPNNAWGGDFTTKPDGNHFSYSYGGVK